MSGGEMVVQTERENSSDGSNGKMTGWFLERGIGCLRCLGLVGEFFALRVYGGNLYSNRDI